MSVLRQAPAHAPDEALRSLLDEGLQPRRRWAELAWHRWRSPELILGRYRLGVPPTLQAGVATPGSCSISMRTSGSLEHAPSKEIEVGAAVHLPLEQLQLVDLALSLPVAPLLGEPGFNR
jgi:hypothetical protein